MTFTQSATKGQRASKDALSTMIFKEQRTWRFSLKISSQKVIKSLSVGFSKYVPELGAMNDINYVKYSSSYN